MSADKNIRSLVFFPLSFFRYLRYRKLQTQKYSIRASYIETCFLVAISSSSPRMYKGLQRRRVTVTILRKEISHV